MRRARRENLAAAFGFENALRRGWMLEELRRGTNRSWRKVSAAVRTDTVESCFNARAAERALVRAYHRIGRRRREILIAAFATGTQFEHR